MKRASSLSIATYRQASKSAAAWARRKSAELQARALVDAEKPAPRFGLVVLAALIALGISAAVVGLTH